MHHDTNKSRHNNQDASSTKTKPHKQSFRQSTTSPDEPQRKKRRLIRNSAPLYKPILPDTTPTSVRPASSTNSFSNSSLLSALCSQPKPQRQIMSSSLASVSNITMRNVLEHKQEKIDNYSAEKLRERCRKLRGAVKAFKHEISQLHSELQNLESKYKQFVIQETEKCKLKMKHETNKLHAENVRLKSRIRNLEKQLKDSQTNYNRFLAAVQLAHTVNISETNLSDDERSSSVQALEPAKWYRSHSIDKLFNLIQEHNRREQETNEHFGTVECHGDFDRPVYINAIKRFLGHGNFRQNKIIKYYIPQVYKKQIRSEDPIPPLKGEYGLFTKEKLPPFTVIGRYIGHELTVRESDSKHRKDKPLQKIYSFDVPLLTEDERGKHERKIESESNSNHRSSHRLQNQKENILDRGDVEKLSKADLESEIESLKYQYNIMVIDAYNPNDALDRPLLSFINDCRGDIFSHEKTEADKQRENIQFVPAVVNGWPMVFGITTDEVQEQSQLFGFYGEQYGETMKECDEYKVQKKITDAKKLLDDFGNNHNSVNDNSQIL